MAGPVPKPQGPRLPSETPPPDPTRRHLRGSSLLLAGRGISLSLNFAVQVATVRYLTKPDYGALGWALSIVSLAASFNLLGLSRAVQRFVPAHHERGDLRSMFGTIVVATGGIVGFGVALVVATLGLRGVLTGSVSNPDSTALLLLLIALAPAEALNHLCQSLASIFVGARAIFVRRHILGPALKLAMVALVIATESSVEMLAIGHLVVGWIGIAIYVGIIHRSWVRSGLCKEWKLTLRSLPVRDTLKFSLPLVTTDVSHVAKVAIAVCFLDALHGSDSVAAFRAVLPVAALNLVVLQSFRMLFVPLASRMHVRGEEAAIHDLFWKTSLWVALLTFPLFAACATLSEPITVLLFETRYATSASTLAVVAHRTGTDCERRAHGVHAAGLWPGSLDLLERRRRSTDHAAGLGHPRPRPWKSRRGDRDRLRDADPERSQPLASSHFDSGPFDRDAVSSSVRGPGRDDRRTGGHPLARSGCGDHRPVPDRGDRLSVASLPDAPRPPRRFPSSRSSAAAAASHVKTPQPRAGSRTLTEARSISSSTC